MKTTSQVVLVTGAGRGFGYGIARAFGLAGARVCLTDIDAGELARAAEELAKDNSTVLARELDVADAVAFQAIVDDIIEHWGRLDVLVNNAVYMPLLRFQATSPELWRRQLDISIGGMYNGTHAVWQTMLQQGGGHIIGIASGSSLRGYVDEVAYCTAKHAQEGFTKALALEAAPHNIAINTIGPGAPIKPTGVDWASLDALPAAARSAWADPAWLGRAFVWLAAQPPSRFSGYRFDAGVLVRTLETEGDDFAFEPSKVTLYVDDWMARKQWYDENK